MHESLNSILVIFLLETTDLNWLMPHLWTMQNVTGPRVVNNFQLIFIQFDIDGNTVDLFLVL